LPDYRAPFERLGVAFTFLFTTKGIPLLYYGDEIGMPGAGDPDNRRFMQWEGYSGDQEFLLARIRKLGAIRRAHPALWKGARTTVSVGTDTYGYRMSDGEEDVYVALNRGDLTAALSGMPLQGLDLLTDANVDGPAVTLPPRSAMVIVRR
jgi:glycosidase